jgi:hypothetical protein
MVGITILGCSLSFPIQPIAASSQDYKAQVLKEIEASAKQTQVMIDTVFSF